MHEVFGLKHVFSTFQETVWSHLKAVSSDAFFYVRLRTYAQYASMNEFTCFEHSVPIHRSKKRSTGNQPLGLVLWIVVNNCVWYTISLQDEVLTRTLAWNPSQKTSLTESQRK